MTRLHELLLVCYIKQVNSESISKSTNKFSLSTVIRQSVPDSRCKLLLEDKSKQLINLCSSNDNCY